MGSNANGLLTLFDEHGNAASYRRVSARIEEFRKAFPIKDGFRVESEIVDALTLQPGIMTLYQEAIRSGQPPKDMGLSAPNGPVQTVCIHRLYNKEGHVVMDARASMVLARHKDLETLETASLQRLMARLGFGGDVVDDDEDGDFKAQGLRVASAPSRPAKAPVAKVDAGAEPEGESSSEATAEATAETPSDEIPTALKRQLEGLRRKNGIDTEFPSTVEEAKRELKELAAKGRKTASA